MPIEADFLEVMLDVLVAQAPGTSRNFRGELIAIGAPVPYRARIVNRYQEMRNAQGDVVTSNTVAYIYGAPGFTTEYVFTLPDGSQPPAIRVEQYPDDSGPYYEAVYFGAVTR